MIVSEIKLYELLKAKIGDREKVKTKLQENTAVFATKEDLAKTEGKLLSTISEAKVDIIKWIVATAIAIVGLTVALVKLG